MNLKNKNAFSYRQMLVLALVVGAVGVGLQFIPGFELLAFMLTAVVLGSLMGGANTYEAQDREQLGQSYKHAFEGLLLVMMAAYTLVALTPWVAGLAGVATFLSGHWPGLVLAVMCLLMGWAGLRKPKAAGSA